MKILLYIKRSIIFILFFTILICGSKVNAQQPTESETEHIAYEKKQAQNEMKTWEPSWETVVKKINGIFDEGMKLADTDKKDEAQTRFQDGLTLYESVKTIKKTRDTELKNYAELTKEPLLSKLPNLKQKIKDLHQKIETKFVEQFSRNKFKNDLVKDYETFGKYSQRTKDILSDSKIQETLNISQEDYDFLQKWDKNNLWQKAKNDYIIIIENENDLIKIRQKLYLAYDIWQKIKTDFVEIDELSKDCERLIPKTESERKAFENVAQPEWKEANDLLKKLDNTTASVEEIRKEYEEATRLLKLANIKVTKVNKVRRTLETLLPKTDLERKDLKNFGQPEWKEVNDRLKKIDKNIVDTDEIIKEYAEITKLLQSAITKVNAVDKARKTFESLLPKTDSEHNALKNLGQPEWNETNERLEIIRKNILDSNETIKEYEEITKLLQIALTKSSIVSKARKDCELLLPKTDSEREIFEHFGSPEWKEANKLLEKINKTVTDNEATKDYEKITKLLQIAQTKANAANDAWIKLKTASDKVDKESWKKYNPNNFDKFQTIFAAIEKYGIDGTTAVRQCQEAMNLIDNSFLIIVAGLNRDNKKEEAAELFNRELNSLRQKLKSEEAKNVNLKIYDELVFNMPDWWIKSLKDANELKSVVDVQRYIHLIEFANAAQDDAMYFEMRKKFFKSLKAITNSHVCIDFVEEILPVMIRRKNFDGLRDIIDDINIKIGTVPKERTSRYLYLSNCAKLAGFAIAMGDARMAQTYDLSVILGSGGKDNITLPLLSRAVALKDINLNGAEKNNFETVFKASMIRYYLPYFCHVGVCLAKKNRKNDVIQFTERIKKSNSYKNDGFCEYELAKANALVGEFSVARREFQVCNQNMGILRQYVLSFIIRQEFLAGEFRGWETMTQDTFEIGSLRSTSRDGIDFSYGVSCFYFDYGRGLARHKTGAEVFQEYEKLCTTLSQTDLAFFMAGVATGSLDRKNPQLARNYQVIDNQQNIEEPQNTNPIRQNNHNSKRIRRNKGRSVDIDDVADTAEGIVDIINSTKGSGNGRPPIRRPPIRFPPFIK